MIKIVHVGAGRHSLDDERRMKKLIIEYLKKKNYSTNNNNNNNIDKESLIPSLGFQYLQLLQDISKGIESCELTNTGRGSSLTINGEVECDSSILLIIDNKRYQTSLLCDSSSELPISECIKKLIEQNCIKFDKFGLTKPMILVKRDKFNDKLITDKNKKIYDRYINDINEYNQQRVSDTIGVSIINIQEKLAITGVSSGGSFFKESGRIGCAGIIGSGLYTILEKDKTTINIMCSGNGEDIIQMDLSRYLCNFIFENRNLIELGEELFCNLLEIGILQAINEINLRSINTNYEKSIYVGCVGYIKINKSLQLIGYIHSTESFIFGFQDSNGKNEVICSRKLGNCSSQTFKKGEISIE